MSRGNRSFDVIVSHDDREIRVVGEISKYYPAIRYLQNGDPGHPAEGGEIEDYKIFDKETGKEVEDPEGKILDDVLDEVYEKVSDGMASEISEHAERARESKEDR